MHGVCLLGDYHLQVDCEFKLGYPKMQLKLLVFMVLYLYNTNENYNSIKIICDTNI